MLEDLIKKQYTSESVAELRPVSSSERIISLYLDAPQFIEWKALVFDGSDPD